MFLVAILFAFDLIEVDGDDWRPKPLQERKAKLEKADPSD